jgi:hypothetical protein
MIAFDFATSQTIFHVYPLPLVFCKILINKQLNAKILKLNGLFVNDSHYGTCIVSRAHPMSETQSWD